MSERLVPFCDEEKCFACKKHHCTILTEALNPCSFFKTKEEEREEVIKAYRRLTSKGYNVKREFPALYSEYKKAVM